MIEPWSGPDLGIARNENYLLYAWNKRVIFSMAQRGKAMCCHFSSSKKDLRQIKTAINEFCEWVFDNFECKIILAFINKPSVVRLVLKCGFKHVLTYEEGDIYARSK